jgi:uncharacterized membrane protein YtjA (UPF0391 family)
LNFFRCQKEMQPLAGSWVYPRMLRWAVIFALIAVVAGALGFTGVAGASAAIAKILFFICISVFLLLLVAALAISNKISK